jgi:hypothetical protein
MYSADKSSLHMRIVEDDTASIDDQDEQRLACGRMDWTRATVFKLTEA